jgi:23S rRNA pseudouridine2605 synthase/23S rRNA pseudouridine2604 synthase
MSKIRLQKYCSEKGIASRRRAEEYIKNGWIKVNGQVVTELGIKVDPQNDVVELNEGALENKKAFKYVLLNKPVGYVTNLPQAGEKEAKDLLPDKFKNLHVVGRLDKDSEGLLLFTDDGVAAHRLASPKFEHEKEYRVTVDQVISPEVLAKYHKGITLAGEQLKPVEVKKIKGLTYRFVLREGKNRQIRRMLKKFGYYVVRLKRVRIANLKLGELKPGQYRALSETELEVCQEYLLDKHFYFK